MFKHIKMSGKTKLTNVDEAMVQMHTVDIRIDRVYALTGEFELHEDSKVHRDKHEIYPDENGTFVLLPGTLYQFDTVHKVEMAQNECGWIIGRSTLQRNGVIVQSALYDAGYKGGVNGTIFNTTPWAAKIAKGARVGQFMLAQADTYKLYEGDYNEQ